MPIIHLPGQTMQMLKITFRKLFAKEMMYNRITESGGVRSSPIKARKRSKQSIEFEHELVKKPKYTRRYDASEKVWIMSSQAYLNHKCKTLSKNIRTYCICNKAHPMCLVCFARHHHKVCSAI